METRLWTVVRFPAGIWSGGGKPSDPDYEECEVYRIMAESLEKATVRAKSVRARLVKKGSALPTQASPYTATALPSGAVKVFGGLKQVQGKQLRTIVAASSQKKAAELLGVSVSFLKDYYAPTGDRTEVAAALAAPGIVLQATGERSAEYLPVKTGNESR